ncbi:MAG: hypothetical protein JSU01_10560 [Bacteroidetes bacterium]|nr:hypothetical protein [Bacteroidota bacterium]
MKNIIKAILLMAAVIMFSAPKIQAQVSVDISIQASVAPPVIPVYEQPRAGL